MLTLEGKIRSLGRAFTMNVAIQVECKRIGHRHLVSRRWMFVY